MTLCGTAEYMAPELMFDEENYSFEIDIFSFGMVLLEVLKRGKVGQGGFAERNPRTL
jgi:serine/threonine protein kinase